MIELRIHFPVIHRAISFMEYLVLGSVHRNRRGAPALDCERERYACPPIGPRRPPMAPWTPLHGMGSVYCAGRRARPDAAETPSEPAADAGFALYASVLRLLSEKTPTNVADALDKTSRLMFEADTEPTRPQIRAAMRALGENLRESAAELRAADTSDKALRAIQKIGPGFSQAWQFLCEDIVADLYPEA